MSTFEDRVQPPIVRAFPELVDTEAWMWWREEHGSGPKPLKIPYRVDKPSTKFAPDVGVGVVPLREAWDLAVQKGGFVGLSMLRAPKTLVIIDFDNCVRKKRIVIPEVQAVVDAFHGAALELSHSGSGCHLIFMATVEELARLRIGPGSRHVEYLGCRFQVFIGGDASFVAVTGNMMRRDGSADWDATKLVRQFTMISGNSERVKVGDIDIDELTRKESEALAARINDDIAAHIDGLGSYKEKPDGSVDRSDADMRLAHLCVKARLTSREYAHLVRGMDDDLTQKDDRQMRRCWAKALRKAEEEAFDGEEEAVGEFDAGGPLMPLYDAAIADRPEPRFLIYGLVPVGASYLLGAPGRGKSSVAVLLGVHAAAGRSLFGGEERLGEIAEPISVVYVPAEDMLGLLDRAEASLTDDPTLWDAARDRFFVWRAPFNLLDPKDCKKLKREIAKLPGPTMVIIDTLASAGKGGIEFKEEGELGQAIHNSIALADAALLVHHTVKSSWSKDEIDAASAYGAGVGYGVLRGILTVGKSEMRVAKMSGAKEDVVIAIERDVVNIQSGRETSIVMRLEEQGAREALEHEMFQVLKPGVEVEFSTLRAIHVRHNGEVGREATKKWLVRHKVQQTRAGGGKGRPSLWRYTPTEESPKTPED